MNNCKKIILILTLSLIFPNLTDLDLIEFDGKFYAPNSYIPFTGEITNYYSDSYLIYSEKNYLNGIINGEYVEYYENGNIKIKGLLIIYFSTFLVWTKDESNSLDKTMTALDNYLIRAENFFSILKI